MKDVPCMTFHFWSTREELTAEEGVLLKGNRVRIPLNYMTGPLMTFITITKR